MLLAMFQYFAGNFTFYICISWMHPYLIEHYWLTQSQAARYSMIPLLCGASSNWVAGFVVDALVQIVVARLVAAPPRRGRFRARDRRRLVGSFADSATSAIVGFAVATFGVEMTISPSWAFCLDIGGKDSGTVSATMNTAGNFGGFVSTNAFPLLRG